MKLLSILFCLNFFTIGMSLRRAGLSRMHNQGASKLLTRATKLRSKFPSRHLKKMKTVFLPSSEREQNQVLESMSPEYKYKDVESTETQNNDPISKLLDDQTIQELTSKNLLDSDSKHSSRRKLGLLNGLGRVTTRPGPESLEHLNIMLQNTLPEYKFDRAERGPGFTYDSCVDLDPDCWKYEFHGLCSDSPDLAEKRFNCKKTCHLCSSSTGTTRRHTKKGARQH